MTDAVRAYLDNLARDPLRDDLRVILASRVVGRFLRCEIEWQGWHLAQPAASALSAARAA